MVVSKIMAETAAGILLLTHGRQGESLLESVSHMLGEWPARVVTISLLGTERRSEIEQRGRAVVEQLSERGEGVLILSDLFGSTQANIADKLAATSDNTACVHGVNLTMLLEAVSMRQLPLAELQKRVVTAGRKSILYGGRRR